MGIKRLGWWMVIFFHCPGLAAQEAGARGLAQEAGAGGDGMRFRVRVSTGYQQESFHWSIAGNSTGQDPNVYSELKWRRVGGPLAGVALEGDFFKRWSFFADGGRVFTRSGRVSDTDYGGDNRTDAVYQQGFDSREGYSYAVSAGVGYRLMVKPRLRLTPYLGYGWSGESFSILDPGGVYAFLNSDYVTRWKGPLGKLDGAGRLAGRWEWEANVVYHQVGYGAKADWNLISTFNHPVSFRHEAEGYGVDLHAGFRYRVGRFVMLRAGGGYFNWQTGKGTDELYLSSGAVDRTRLNGVGREGWKGEVGVEITAGQ